MTARYLTNDRLTLTLSGTLDEAEQISFTKFGLLTGTHVVRFP